MNIEKAKEGLRSFLETGLDRDLICLYCKRCEDCNIPEDDCNLEPENIDCIEAYMEMASDVYL